MPHPSIDISSPSPPSYPLGSTPIPISTLRDTGGPSHYIANKDKDISDSLANLDRSRSHHATRSDATMTSTSLLTSQMNRQAFFDLHDGERMPDIGAEQRSGGGRAQGSAKREYKPSYVVISGGTAANDFVHAFGQDCAFVLPVSDDGGSSSEILRVLGGPAIGDIRSRLIRLIPIPSNNALIPDDGLNPHLPGIQAVHDLFAHRFPKQCSERQAKDMWADLVECKSLLWRGVPADRRECIRSFFVHFNTLILRRSHKKFSFRNCSVGNAFLAAARDMLGGLPGAIFMFRAVTDSQGAGEVFPVVLTNQRITIAARLENGDLITGQCEISHPAPLLPPTPGISRASPAPSYRKTRRRKDSMSFATGDSSDESQAISSDEDTLSIYSTSASSATSGYFTRATPRAAPVITQGSPWRESPLTATMHDKGGGFDFGLKPRGGTIKRSVPAAIPALREEEVDRNSMYAKGEQETPLAARIERVFYINDYGQEIKPDPNVAMIENLAKKDILVYSCGSLWTSIVPCLALKGVATAIARSRTLRAKVLLLNSKNDRETSSYTALDYVSTVINMLNSGRHVKKGESEGTAHSRRKRDYPAGRLVTHLVYLEGGQVEVEEEGLQALGIALIMVPKQAGTRFTSQTVEWAMRRIYQAW